MIKGARFLYFTLIRENKPMCSIDKDIFLVPQFQVIEFVKSRSQFGAVLRFQLSLLNKIIDGYFHQKSAFLKSFRKS